MIYGFFIEMDALLMKENENDLKKRKEEAELNDIYIVEEADLSEHELTAKKIHFKPKYQEDVSVCVYMIGCLYVRLCDCMCMCVSMCLYMCVGVCMCICVYVCVYVCVCMYVCVSTKTHYFL